MQLSARMERLASKVPYGSRLADVGTDHGYIPIALVLRGKISSAVAMDVNPGPLKRAEEHIRGQKLSAYIETRLSDGLTALQAGEADTVLIAGMGGALTVRILKGGAHCLCDVKELILQPQSEIHLVRKWLCENGYRITEEDMVQDAGKFYPIMKAVHGEQQTPGEVELYYGSTDRQKSPAVFEAYIRNELRKNENIRRRLKEHGQENSVRMGELEKEKRRLEEALYGISRQKRGETGYEMQ